MMDVFVNGHLIEFDEQTRLDFSGVYIQKHNQSKIGIYFTSGVSIDTRAIEDFLVYLISIPTRFKGLCLIRIKELLLLPFKELLFTCLKYYIEILISKVQQKRPWVFKQNFAPLACTRSLYTTHATQIF